MKVFRWLLLFVSLLSAGPSLQAQGLKDPTAWTYVVKQTGPGHYNLIFHLVLNDKWHVYAMKPGGDGSMIPPSFTFDKQAGVKLIGGVKEVGKLQTQTVDGIDGALHYFKDGVDFVQQVAVTGHPRITGKHEYQVCNDSMCLPPKQKQFCFRYKVIG